jgi:hypothetical protein
MNLYFMVERIMQKIIIVKINMNEIIMAKIICLK